MMQFLSELGTKIAQGTKRYIRHLRSKLINLSTEEPTRLAARDESRRAHATVVIDLFATIMSRVEGIGMDDMDTTMDMLRYDFPNVEHSWLAERFQETYKARHSLTEALALAAANRTIAERVALSLEIQNMLYRVGGDLTNPSLFSKVTDGLNLPGYAAILEKLIETPGLLAASPIECLRFSPDVTYANITLSPEDSAVRFRALSCAHVLLIVNDSPTPLTFHGRVLYKGDMQILSPGQYIELKGGSLNYNIIRTFIQSYYSKTVFISYLHADGDDVSVSKHRLKNCIAKLRFGVHVEIELLNKDAEFYLDGERLYEGSTVCTTYYTPFTVNGLGPYCLAELHETEATGRSYQLAPESRKILVTNLPYVNKHGALMLSPGLAPGFILEVSYSRANNCGKLKLIEGYRHSVSVNGTPLKENTVTLKDGDLIGLGSIQYLRCRFEAGVLDEETALISELKVQGLSKDFVRAGRVVDNIDFSLRRGEMACILGPSGSGKSTLLSMLAGHLEPSIGSIYYNNERLTTSSANLRQHIAFIPREDILDEGLTVGEHVYQASVARRPRLTAPDRRRRVQAVLNFVGLSALSNRRVGRKGERSLSDGERTRLNLALDLTGTSEVFLIDEPISGLASSDAERVIDTLHNMAAGRIVICSLHRPSQTILNHFSKVMVLNSHGQMAFWGTPGEMKDYFRNSAIELGLHVSREAKAAGGAEYAFEVMAAPFRRLGNHQLPSADMWQERFEKHLYSRKKQVDITPIEGRSIPQTQCRSVIELWRLFSLWFVRTWLGRLRSRLSLYAMLLEAPVLALLIAGTLRSSGGDEYIFYDSLHICEYLFLSLVLAMFFGLTGSACEIIRDRQLIRRESNYRLFIPGYLLAKVLVLTGIAALQCALYLMVSNAILEIQSMFWPYFGIMVLTAFIGIALSLMVSAIVKTERAALNIVPLLLVPQILLAGALIRFEDMNEFCPDMPSFVPEFVTNTLNKLRHRVAYQDKVTHEIKTKPVPLIAEFCPLRYSFEMMFVTQNHYNLWEVEFKRIEKQMHRLKSEVDTLKRVYNEMQEAGANATELKKVRKRYTAANNKLKQVRDAILLINAEAKTTDEARDILRLTRKAALTYNQELIDILIDKLEKRPEDYGHAVERFFTNHKLIELGEGVNLARKDDRISEHRGFFLAPRQPAPFGEMNQQTESGSVSTHKRNVFYLAFMGLCPILVAWLRLKQICRRD